jgi:glucose/arabinose dehydrogenase
MSNSAHRAAAFFAAVKFIQAWFIPAQSISAKFSLARLALIPALLSLCLSPLHSEAQEDYPPGTFRLTPQVDLGLVETPLEVPAAFSHLIPGDRKLLLPPGFSAKVFAAADLQGPRMMAWGPDSVLYLANMRGPTPNSGFIAALPDRDLDGVADGVEIVADGFSLANSLGFYGDTLYVADTHQLLLLRDLDQDGFYEQRQVIATVPTGGTHVTRSVLVDSVNQRLFLSIGTSCDVCREDDPLRGTILEMGLDGSDQRIFASGVRNAVGITLHPQTNQLWATNNGHNQEGSNLPPEWIDIIRRDGFYGSPFAYGYQVFVDFSIPSYGNAVLPLTQADSLLVQSMQRPVALLPARLAPMGIHFYTGTAFPTPYRDAAFVALRSGFNAEVPGYKVAALFTDPDGGNARVGDFMRGFQPVTQSLDGVWAQPVGITSDAAGHLYVSSDWLTFAVLRLSAPVVTAVSESRTQNQPQHTSLAQNFPNPFNSGTVIEFETQQPDQVELSVYNLQGQKVAELAQGFRQAGGYRVDWDGRDDQGRTLASGVYLYRLRVGDFSSTRRLLLLR